MTAIVPFFSLLYHGDFDTLKHDYEHAGQEHFLPTIPVIKEMTKRLDDALDPLIKNYNIFMVRAYEMTEPLILYICMKIRREVPDAIIIMGDKNRFIDSVFTDRLLNDSYIDTIVSGFGETPLDDIMNSLVEGRDIHKEYEGGVPYKPYNPLHRKMFDDGWTGLRTSYACLYNCSFCSNFTNIKPSQRTIPPKTIIGQLKYLKNYHGLKEMTFCDSLFYSTEEELNEFYDGLVENDLTDIFFNLLYIKADLTLKKPELYTRFNASFLCGMESMDDRVLQIMGKSHTSKMNLEVMKIFSNAGKFIQCNFIYGHPGETIDMFNSNLKVLPIANKNKNILVSLNKFRLRANCPVDRNPDKYGLVFKYNKNIPIMFNTGRLEIADEYIQENLGYKDEEIRKLNFESTISNLPNMNDGEPPEIYRDKTVFFYRGCDA